MASTVVVLQPLAASAAGDTAAKVAKLMVVGPDTVEVELDRVSTGGNETTMARQRGQARPVVTNTGDAPAALRFGAFLDAGSGRCANAPIEVAPREALTALKPDTTVAPILDLTLQEGCAGREGTILIYGGSGVAPVSVRFVLVRAVERVQYWYPLIGGALVSLLFILVILVIRGRRLLEEVATGPSWSFKDSWLTSITALGAILGTVLAAAGFLEEVLPGLNSARLLGLNFVFGGMVLSAPIIYSTASKWVPERSKKDGEQGVTLAAKGRVCGIVFATAVTLWGVLGQIGTMIALNAAADAGRSAKWTIGALLVAAAILTVCYALAWTIGVTQELTLPAPVPAPPAPVPAPPAPVPPAEEVPVHPTPEISATL